MRAPPAPPPHHTTLPPHDLALTPAHPKYFIYRSFQTKVESLVNKTSMLFTDLLECSVPFNDVWYQALVEPIWHEEWDLPDTWTRGFVELRGSGCNLKNSLLDRIVRGGDGAQPNPLILVDLLARCVASDEFLHHLKGLLLENKAVAGRKRPRAAAGEAITLPRWWTPLKTAHDRPATYGGKYMVVPPPATYVAAVLLLAHWLEMFATREGEAKPRFDYASFEPRIEEYLPAVKAHHARLRPADFAGWEGCTCENFAPRFLGAYNLRGHENAEKKQEIVQALNGASSGGGFLRNQSARPLARQEGGVAVAAAEGSSAEDEK